MRISACDWVQGGTTVDDAVAISRRLREAGADMVHCSSGEVTPEQLRRLTLRNMLGQVGYAIAVALAFVSPPASLALCGAIALYYVHPGRSEAG